MEETLFRMYVQTLRAKLELSRITAVALMESLQSPKLTVQERRAGFRQWADVTRDGDILAFTLELIRRHDEEAKSFAQVNVSGRDSFMGSKQKAHHLG